MIRDQGDSVTNDTRNGTPDQPNSDIYIAQVAYAAVKTGAETS